MAASAYDQLAYALEKDTLVFLGIVPTTEPAMTPTDSALTERVLRLLDMLGLDPATVTERLVITPACGLAGATPGWARSALALSRRVAGNLDG